MADKSEVWLKLIEQQWLQARQSENTRAQATTLVVTLVAALQTLIVQRQFDRASLFLAFLVLLFSVYGWIISANLYDRFRQGMHRVGGIIRQLDAYDPDLLIKATEEESDRWHAKEFPRLRKLRLHKIWHTLFLFISLMALVDMYVIEASSTRVQAQGASKMPLAQGAAKSKGPELQRSAAARAKGAVTPISR